MNNDEHCVLKQNSAGEPSREEVIQVVSDESTCYQEEKPAVSLCQQWKALSLDKQIQCTIAVIGIFIAVGAGCIAFSQLDAMRAQTQFLQEQLSEMKQGSLDTQAIAKSSINQSVNTKLLAEAAVAQVRQLQAGVDETHKLAIATQSSLQLSKEQFVENIRPYVIVKHVEPVEEVPKLTHWNIFYENYGRSPAINGRANAKVFVGKGTEDIANRYFVSLPQPLTSGTLFVLPPSGL